MSQRLEDLNDRFIQGPPQSIRDAAAQAWDPRYLEQKAAKPPGPLGQFLDCSPVGGDRQELSVKPTSANSVLSCEVGGKKGSGTDQQTGSDTGAEAGPEAGAEAGPEAGAEAGSEAGSQTGSDSQPAMNEMMKAIMSALEQALKESGGDPAKFMECFMKDLMQALQQLQGGGTDSASQPGGGSASGGEPGTPDANTGSPAEPGSAGGGDTGTGAGSGSGAETGKPATGVASLLNFSNDPKASKELRQQLTQELNNLPANIQNQLLQQKTQINIVPESQLGNAAGLYDTGNNQITIGDGSGVEQEALAHEIGHAIDLGPNGDSITNSAGFQNAMNADLQNGLPANFADYASTLDDTPTNNQFGFGEGDVYAEIAAGLLGQDQSGLPQEIAGDFPNTTAYVAQELGLANRVG